LPPVARDVVGNLVEGVFHAFFTSCQVQDEQTFVFFHFFFVRGADCPLNWFIAFAIRTPASILIWSAARFQNFFQQRVFHPR